MIKIVTPTPTLRFEVDDLCRPPVRDPVARHLAGMQAQSPPQSVGFTTCGPFDSYGPDPFSVFMTLRL
jgi:hypothetical protein